MRELGMAFENKIYITIVGLIAQLFFSGYVAAESLEPSANSFEQKLSLSDSAPERNHLGLVSLFPVVVKGKVVGEVAVYDNTTTEKHPAYRELYDSAGDLLAFSWFDKFGIERMAVDRGLLEDGEGAEGVFVVFSEGESV
jgi:hypothetical protein